MTSQREPRADNLDLRFIPIRQLHPHEAVLPSRLETVTDWIGEHQMLPHPVTVIEVAPSKFLIADGHHRAEAMRRLGAEVLLAHIVASSSVKVNSWAHEVSVDAKSLVDAFGEVPGVTIEAVDARTAHMLTWRRERVAAVVGERGGAWTVRADGNAAPGPLLERLHENYAGSYVNALPIGRMAPSFPLVSDGHALVLLRRFTVAEIAREVMDRKPIRVPKLTRFGIPGGKLADTNCPLDIQRPGATPGQRDEWLQSLMERPLEKVRRFSWI